MAEILLAVQSARSGGNFNHSANLLQVKPPFIPFVLPTIAPDIIHLNQELVQEGGIVHHPSDYIMGPALWLIPGADLGVREERSSIPRQRWSREKGSRKQCLSDSHGEDGNFCGGGDDKDQD
jgi:hypothetical protein